MSFKKITRLITSDGWVPIIIGDFHTQYGKPGYPAILIPNHTDDLSIRVIRHLEKITGLALQG